jgi:hypothetical protein
MPLTQIPSSPVIIHDNVLGKLPSIWYGETALDGTVAPFTTVAVGSIYVDNSSGTAVLYMKKVATAATASWGTVTLT